MLTISTAERNYTQLVKDIIDKHRFFFNSKMWVIQKEFHCKMSQPFLADISLPHEFARGPW